MVAKPCRRFGLVGKTEVLGALDLELLLELHWALDFEYAAAVRSRASLSGAYCHWFWLERARQNALGWTAMRRALVDGKR